MGSRLPKTRPPKSSSRLNKEVNAGLTDPKTKQRLADLGCLIFGGSPADFGRFIAGEIEKWTKVIRTAGIKAE